MTPTLPPVGRTTTQVSDCVRRPTLLVSECIGVLTLSELKKNDTTISQTLFSVGQPMLQRSDDIEFSTVYAILVGTLEWITVEHATQWSIRASNLISRWSKIWCYATDGKKKCMCRIPNMLVSNFRHGSRQIFASNFVVHQWLQWTLMRLTEV